MPHPSHSVPSHCPPHPVPLRCRVSPTSSSTPYISALPATPTPRTTRPSCHSTGAAPTHQPVSEWGRMTTCRRAEPFAEMQQQLKRFSKERGCRGFRTLLMHRGVLLALLTLHYRLRPLESLNSIWLRAGMVHTSFHFKVHHHHVQVIMGISRPSARPPAPVLHLTTTAPLPLQGALGCLSQSFTSPLLSPPPPPPPPGGT